MWRSQLLKQKQNLALLYSARAQGKLAHALLFYGAEGSGTLVHALEMALSIFCKNPVDGAGCGNCSSCRKVTQLNHPDLHFLLPTIGSNVKSTDFYTQFREACRENPYLSAYDWLQFIQAENKQGNMNAADCLAAYSQLGMQSFEGGAKVLVIWMGEYLGKEGNKLLKLIEEPPDDSHILIIAQNREAILPTILSRCQQVFFKPYPNEVVSHGLIELKGIKEEKAEMIARSADGNFNLAIQLIDYQADLFLDRWISWIKVSMKGSAMDKVAWADELGKETRERQKQFMRYCLHAVRSAFTHSGSGSTVGEKEEKINQYLRGRLEISDFAEISEMLDQNIRYIMRNANGRIMWLDSTIKFGKILRQVPKRAAYSQ